MKRLSLLVGFLAILALVPRQARAQSSVLEIPRSTFTCLAVSLSSGTAHAVAPPTEGWVFVAIDNEDATNDVRCSEHVAVGCSTNKGKRVKAGDTVGWTLPTTGQWYCVSCKAAGPSNIVRCRVK